MGILSGKRDPGGFRPRILPPIWAVLFLSIAVVIRLVWGSHEIIDRSWVVGLCVTGAGIALILWSAGLFAKAGTPIEPGRVSTSLITAGPYRWSRNPMYTGMTLTLLGLVIVMGSAYGLVVVPAFVVVISTTFIRHEERMLDERFGNSYRKYQADVRRWL